MAKVKIYSTPTCIWCAKTKEFFKTNKVSFTEVDVSSNEKAAEEMVKKSGQRGTPVIEIEGKIVVGYEEDKLKKLLNIK